MRKIALIVLTVFIASNLTVQAQTDSTDVKGILYQIDISVQATERLDDIFRKFSDGYMEADIALQKINLLKHEYDKLAKPVPEPTKRLNQLMKKLLSQLENYFIYFKRTDRESPDINIKVAETKIELSIEMEKLQLLYMME